MFPAFQVFESGNTVVVLNLENSKELRLLNLRLNENVRKTAMYM